MSGDAPTIVNKIKGVPFMGPLSKRVPGTSGNIFFVSSGHLQAKDDPMWGNAPNKPFATIDYAIGQCTASQGDAIMVMPGHAETISLAGGITADVIGIHIIGLGNGRNRPTITVAGVVTASFLVSAASVTVENLYFNCATLDLLEKPINITGADCIFADCEVLCSNATGQCTNVLVTSAGANRLVIEDNRFLAATNDAGLASCILIVGGDGIIIRRNLIHVYGTTTLGCIENNTTATTNIWIDGNVLDNRTALSDNVIALDSGATGWITNNRTATLSAGSDVPVTAAAAFAFGGNYSVKAVGVTAGLLL